ncbi:MAG: ATP-binding cassette domain-containing protein [Ignavibacteriae bacterium]|nr:ATP-binding cassette domain-containing protein [Ignavibacteriota bacterium]NOG96832.1 ATP-binding cassette domain-containing protein [Ignavibacteriota bacterium]
MKNNVTPVILTAMELDVHFGEQIILDNASLSVHEGDRIGLVGRNGVGKSTFLKIISGLMEPDSGNVAKKKELVVGFLTQEFTLDEFKNVYENVLAGADNILVLIDEYESLPFDSPKRNILEEKIQYLDGWNLEKKINQLLKSLNAPEADRAIDTLSGGEKRRVALCRSIVSQPDLLILDEPTNHLDTESIEWIEKFLAAYKGTCIFVTHDRYFLDRIANRIVELTNGQFISHRGNYTDYLVNKAERLAIKEVEERKRQNFLRRELEWVVRGPKARTTKAKSRLDTYYETAAQENTEVELDVEMVIPPAEKLGKNILELKGVGKKLGGKKLIDGLHFVFTPGRRLGIVGKNGVGKTTLLKLLLGEITPDDGIIEIGEKTEFNYVDQSRLLLNDEDTVIEAIGEGNTFIKFGNQQMKVWSYLKKFLFTDERINTIVGRLSGGEKSRLTLARILKNGGNFLMLDEPTNDLDLPTLRILEEALLAFDGCVVVVSHDRYFLNRVCNGILAFEGDGEIYFSEGDYDYYIEKRKSRKKELKPANSKNKKGDTRVKEKVRKLTWKEKKELETIEENILKAEENVERIESIFSSKDFYDKYADKTNELNLELEQAKAKVQKLYERWEELEKIAEMQG